MYRPANKCIYCGCVTNDLRREHVIPYSLGGTFVLPRSSCATHAEVTSRFELTVARDMYGLDRAFSGAPSRKPGTHEKRLSRTLDVRGVKTTGEEVSISVKQIDMPRALIWIEMPSPGFLRGMDPTLNESVTYQGNYAITQKGINLRERYGLLSLRVESSPMNHAAFARLLAKIGHAFTAAELGIDGFSSWLLPLILGEATSLTYLVGGFEPSSQQDERPLRLLETTGGLLITEISLHAFPHLPRYQVVVGRRSEA
jgi:hypothetical protein